MNEKRTTARAFHDADGVEDWRVLFSGAHAYFRVRSFEHGARFVAAIAEVAEAVGHFPDAQEGKWSGRRGSNPRHSAWEADTLPTELLPLGSTALCLARTPRLQQSSVLARDPSGHAGSARPSRWIVS